MAVEREVIVTTTPDTFEGMKISWGGVFGGVLAGVGTLMLLSSLGLAIGVSTVDPRDADASAIGTGAAIWTGLTLLVALFVGGWASTRLSMLWERTTAMFEGALVWVLSLILILYLTANGIALVTGGAFRLASNAAQTAGVSLSDQARAAAAQVEDRIGRATAAENPARVAEEVQPEVTVTAWVTFAALVLSLIAAIAGAAAGRRGVVRKVES